MGDGICILDFAQLSYLWGQDKYYKALEKVIREFERTHQLKIAGLNVQSYSGKKMRAGMTYREIAQLDLFADLELSSLECIYRRAHLNRPG